MSRFRVDVLRWAPALLWMVAIFFASGTPSTNLPQFGSLDYVVKKTGHVLAYAFLALLYRRGLGKTNGQPVVTWLLAVAYALVDEFHQSLVPGRHPSLVDAILFDGGGAAAALLLSGLISRRTSRPLSRPVDRH